MTNPYRGKPDHQFWRKAVASPSLHEVDPAVGARLRIGRRDRIATAGSCFAQHISRTLRATDYNYMVAEKEPALPFSSDENYGVFSARYGNIYTVRQLLQLMRRAYSLLEPRQGWWLRADGRYIDPFRPLVQAQGFETVEHLAADREAHLAAVRSIFEECDVFIFTLGLTEAWVSTDDGCVYPLAPGVAEAAPQSSSAEFRNFTVAEMDADLGAFLTLLQKVNPEVKVILTVSPVPLIATFEDKHVLSATTYSKSALRVVAGQAADRYDWVEYFPSYEMITGAHTRGSFFDDDLRTVRPEGVAYVMDAFSRHHLQEATDPKLQSKPAPGVTPQRAEDLLTSLSFLEVICDEEAIEGEP